MSTPCVCVYLPIFSQDNLQTYFCLKLVVNDRNLDCMDVESSQKYCCNVDLSTSIQSRL